MPEPSSGVASSTIPTAIQRGRRLRGEAFLGLDPLANTARSPPSSATSHAHLARDRRNHCARNRPYPRPDTPPCSAIASRLFLPHQSELRAITLSQSPFVARMNCRSLLYWQRFSRLSQFPCQAIATLHRSDLTLCEPSKDPRLDRFFELLQCCDGANFNGLLESPVAFGPEMWLNGTCAAISSHRFERAFPGQAAGPALSAQLEPVRFLV